MKKLFFLLFISSTISCQKYLDVKPNLGDITPTAARDFQAILDNTTFMNVAYTGIGIVSADNYYVTAASWQTKTNVERNAYLWLPDILSGQPSSEWNSTYRMIGFANTVLDGIKSLKDVNNIRGSALFFRSLGIFNLLNLFSNTYDETSANTDLGVPLRTTSDVNILLPRASVKECFEQIEKDLTEAVTLLPEVGLYQTRPSKAAALFVLSKVYLFKKDYDNALKYSSMAMSIFSTLTDFNTLSATAAQPFNAYPGNKEIIFYAGVNSYVIISGTSPIVDSTLYNSYNSNDLRKTVLYRLNANLPLFKGAYTGLPGYFGGLATNELYLLRAECHARIGNTGLALADLNSLLQKRFRAGTFVPITAVDATDALGKVISERRKELPFTGLVRWEDLKRLNKENRFQQSIERVLNGQKYTLPPNHPNYALPIPDNEIRLSGLIQNPRN